MKKHYRHEDDCLNCGATLKGKFCHVCGQENLQIKESFGHMMNHAISDYFHFDYQFFHTLKPLLFKPGYLTNEYMAGKRVQYLHPIKMYIFISLVYFVLLFSDHKESAHATTVTPATTTKEYQKKATLAPGVVLTTSGDSTYQQYLASQQKLPADKRDGAFGRFISKKSYEEGGDKKLSEGIKHYIPKMMFLLLPLFAFILNITFWRSKKFYVEHLIYSFHLHCFLFLFLSVVMLIQLVLPDSWDTVINIIAVVVIAWYLYQSLRVVYNRTRIITLLKAATLTFSYLFVFGICMLMLLIATAILE